MPCIIIKQHTLALACQNIRSAAAADAYAINKYSLTQN